MPSPLSDTEVIRVFEGNGRLLALFQLRPQSLVVNTLPFVLPAKPNWPTISDVEIHSLP